MYYPSNSPYPAKKVIMVDLSKMKKGVGNPPADGVKDGFPTFDFDDTVDEECFAIFFGPLGWKPGSDATFRLGFFVDTAPAAAKNVVWGIEYKSIACADNFDFAAGTTTVLDIVALTTGTPANDCKIHCAELVIPSAGLVEGGILMIRVYRDANHGSDDFVGDARAFDLHIHYIADKAGVAV